MKTDHLKESNNIEDRRNEGGGSASYGSQAMPEWETEYCESC